MLCFDPHSEICPKQNTLAIGMWSKTSVCNDSAMKFLLFTCFFVLQHKHIGRYMAEILQIRRKTSSNQSIISTLHGVVLFKCLFGIFCHTQKFFTHMETHGQWAMRVRSLAYHIYCDFGPLKENVNRSTTF